MRWERKKSLVFPENIQNLLERWKSLGDSLVEASLRGLHITTSPAEGACTKAPDAGYAPCAPHKPRSLSRGSSGRSPSPWIPGGPLFLEEMILWGDAQARRQ